jgi:hypothetical protein
MTPERLPGAKRKRPGSCAAPPVCAPGSCRCEDDREALALYLLGKWKTAFLGGSLSGVSSERIRAAMWERELRAGLTEARLDPSDDARVVEAFFEKALAEVARETAYPLPGERRRT